MCVYYALCSTCLRIFHTQQKIDHNVLTEIMSDFLKTVSRIFNSRGGGGGGGGKTKKKKINI